MKTRNEVYRELAHSHLWHALLHEPPFLTRRTRRNRPLGPWVAPDGRVDTRNPDIDPYLQPEALTVLGGLRGRYGEVDPIQLHSFAAFLGAALFTNGPVPGSDVESWRRELSLVLVPLAKLDLMNRTRWENVPAPQSDQPTRTQWHTYIERELSAASNQVGHEWPAEPTHVGPEELFCYLRAVSYLEPEEVKQSLAFVDRVLEAEKKHGMIFPEANAFAHLMRASLARYPADVRVHVDSAYRSFIPDRVILDVERSNGERLRPMPATRHGAEVAQGIFDQAMTIASAEGTREDRTRRYEQVALVTAVAASGMAPDLPGRAATELRYIENDVSSLLSACSLAGQGARFQDEFSHVPAGLEYTVRCIGVPEGRTMWRKPVERMREVAVGAAQASRDFGIEENEASVARKSAARSVANLRARSESWLDPERGRGYVDHVEGDIANILGPDEQDRGDGPQCDGNGGVRPPDPVTPRPGGPAQELQVEEASQTAAVTTDLDVPAEPAGGEQDDTAGAKASSRQAPRSRARSVRHGPPGVARRAPVSSRHRGAGQRDAADGRIDPPATLRPGRTSRAAESAQTFSVRVQPDSADQTERGPFGEQQPVARPPADLDMQVRDRSAGEAAGGQRL